MSFWVRTVVVTAKPVDAEPAIRGHLEHLRDLHQQGRLHVAGSFTHNDGFLDIFQAKDLLDAEATARSSPLIEEGLAAWTLREWIAIETGA